jgi:diguanylate cyclase (GGDEF)-like protein
MHLATHDVLTDLPNRAAFTDRLSLEIEHARRERQGLAVMLLDLDRFKQVNDTLGHAAGDQVLRAVSDRLRAALRRSDTIARLGGDEFLLVVPEVGRPRTRPRWRGRCSRPYVRSS